METKLPHRKFVRLAGYDYATSGAYFITICTLDRQCLFGKIIDSKVELSTIGQIVEKSWQWLAERYSVVHLDESIVMPNHLHAILWLKNSCPKPLGSLIGVFKTVSNHSVKQYVGHDCRIWQRNYYEHVIRDEASLLELRRYIRDNPIKWALDNENPNRM